MENQSKFNSSKEVITYLAKRFPLCFVTEGEARPLKIGIFKDLVERLSVENDDLCLSRTQLRSAIRLYTLSWRYLHGVREGAHRVDLDGNDCGELTAEHVEHARQKLAEAKSRVQEQRAARQQKSSDSVDKNTERHSPDSRRKGNNRPDPNRMAGKGKVKSKPLSSVKIVKPSAKSSRSKDSAVVQDINELTVGQDVRVKAGKSLVDATILEITKDGLRVQLSSGLAMIVRTEHLQF